MFRTREFRTLKLPLQNRRGSLRIGPVVPNSPRGRSHGKARPTESAKGSTAAVGNPNERTSGCCRFALQAAGPVSAVLVRRGMVAVAISDDRSAGSSHAVLSRPKSTLDGSALFIMGSNDLTLTAACRVFQRAGRPLPSGFG